MTTCYHSINNLTNLKGASSVQQRNSNNNGNISFPYNEVDLITNVINIAGFYVSRNPQVFQQPEEILRKLT